MPTPSGFDPALVRAALDAARALPAATPVFAITGLQGSGKSTLAAQLVAAAGAEGLRAVTLSIDDVYLTRADRERLAREVHPLLATRGPPGTHDLPLALATLDALREGRPTALPRFDKLADERLPPSRWPQMNGHVDLVVFEGWFLKTPAEPDASLAAPLNALEREEDPDGRWRRRCNEALARDYPALWQRIDALWFLRGPGFDVVPEWRWQQEQALQAAEPGRTGMRRGEIERFVQFYERVSRQALRSLPAIAERTLPLDHMRRPGRSSARRGTSVPEC